jgi:hypothetical protein
MAVTAVSSASESKLKVCFNFLDCIECDGGAEYKKLDHSDKAIDRDEAKHGSFDKE